MDIAFDQGSRSSIQAGIEKLAAAVGVTLGPRGCSILLFFLLCCVYPFRSSAPVNELTEECFLYRRIQNHLATPQDQPVEDLEKEACCGSDPLQAAG
jgi:hypothetical protein